MSEIKATEQCPSVNAGPSKRQVFVRTVFTVVKVVGWVIWLVKKFEDVLDLIRSHL